MLYYLILMLIVPYILTILTITNDHTKSVYHWKYISSDKLEKIYNISWYITYIMYISLLTWIVILSYNYLH